MLNAWTFPLKNFSISCWSVIHPPDFKLCSVFKTTQLGKKFERCGNFLVPTLRRWNALFDALRQGIITIERLLDDTFLNWKQSVGTREIIKIIDMFG
jgi:hypothetical protein